MSKKDTAEKKVIYHCKVCGWEYDPETGDEANGVEPGVAFEDIICPLCGVDSEDFEKIEQ